MQRYSTPDEIRELTWKLRQRSKSIGLVPTMGALHEGHLSLIRQSRQQCDATIATIFVNPTQFAAGEDLDQYPRTLQEDLGLLEREGVDGVFVPTAGVMYPEGFSTYVHPPEIAHALEGTFRPQFFRGVTTVVLKLFHAIPATHAFFGKKDYQQLRVIETMVRDLDVGIEVVAGDIVRESDGLAMSSRNRYLSEPERRTALRLSRALDAAEAQAGRGERNAEALEQTMREVLLGPHKPPEQSDELGNGVDQIDYAEIVDRRNLHPLDELDQPAVALIAAKVGQTRLIDNREL